MSLPPPKDNYAGEPGYPSPWTTGQPKEGLRDTGEARIICLAPDVCLTPTGKSVEPVPYQIVDYCGDDQGYTPSVRFTGQKAMVLRSSTTCVHGDAPGTRKGVKSGTVEDICEPIGHAPQVRAEGSNVIRHLDRFHMNCKNTVGEAVFVKDTGTYEAPTDDDPVRGSLVLSGEPILLAFDASSPEAQQLLRDLMAKQQQSQTAPKRLGPFGRPMPGTGLAGVAIALGELQNEYYPGSRLWRLQRSLEDQGIPIDPGDPYELKALSDYSENLGGTSFLERNFYPPMTETEALGQLQTDLAEARKEEANDATRAVLSSPKLDLALQNNVRVDTKEDEWPCVVGPYEFVEKVCPGEAHHIIPDMVYRLGKAPKTQAEKKSTGNRIPNAPTYNQGQAICLSPTMHRTGKDEDAPVHRTLNPALRNLGLGYNPQGTAPLGKIRDEAQKAIDRVQGLPEKCKRMAKIAVAGQVAGKRHQPGRTTTRLPTNPDVIEVLTGGSYKR